MTELSIKKKYSQNQQSLSRRCEVVITVSRAVYWIKGVTSDGRHCLQKSFNRGSEV